MDENALGIIRYAISILQFIGIGASVVVLAILGIRWFFGGSQEKANVKSKLWTYVLGMFLLICGPLLMNVAVETITILTGDLGTVDVATVPPTGTGGGLSETGSSETGASGADGSGVEIPADEEEPTADDNGFFTFNPTDVNINDFPDNGSDDDSSFFDDGDFFDESFPEEDYTDDSEDGDGTGNVNFEDGAELIDDITKMSARTQEYTFSKLASVSPTLVASGEKTKPEVTFSVKSGNVNPGQKINIVIKSSVDIDGVAWRWTEISTGKKTQIYKYMKNQKKGYVTCPTKKGDYKLEFAVRDVNGYYQNGTKSPTALVHEYTVTSTSSGSGSGSGSGESKQQKLVNLASKLNRVGIRYDSWHTGNANIYKKSNGKYTGTGDCVSSIKWIYKTAINKNLSGSYPVQLANNGKVVCKRSDGYSKCVSKLKPGDLLFFKWKTYGHVAMCVGDDGRLIEHDGSSNGLSYSKLGEKLHANYFYYARRVI